MSRGVSNADIKYEYGSLGCEYTINNSDCLQESWYNKIGIQELYFVDGQLLQELAEQVIDIVPVQVIIACVSELLVGRIAAHNVASEPWSREDISVLFSRKYALASQLMLSHQISYFHPKNELGVSKIFDSSHIHNSSILDFQFHFGFVKISGIFVMTQKKK